MADPFHHAISSSRKWGGEPEDYLTVHRWFDESKNHFAGPQHRALRHHSQGIAEAIVTFGQAITISTGRRIPTRWIGEQHVQEDLGRVPSLSDWFSLMKVEPWMHRAARKLSKELEKEDAHA